MCVGTVFERLRSIYIYTVKLANKDRPWEVKKTVFVHRLALFGGLITDAIFIGVHGLHTFFHCIICLKINHKLVGKSKKD